MSSATTDSRPPLRLTAAEARDWFRTHSEDVGRPVVLVDSPVRPCPPAVVAAYADVGRWEAGLYGGAWPAVTWFARSFLGHLPPFARLGGRRSTVLTLTGAAGAARYYLECPPPPIVARDLERAGLDVVWAVRLP